MYREVNTLKINYEMYKWDCEKDACVRVFTVCLTKEIGINFSAKRCHRNVARLNSIQQLT
jgi:hypothetical protein